VPAVNTAEITARAALMRLPNEHDAAIVVLSVRIDGE